jgi:Fic family protein
MGMNRVEVNESRRTRNERSMFYRRRDKKGDSPGQFGYKRLKETRCKRWAKKKKKSIARKEKKREIRKNRDKMRRKQGDKNCQTDETNGQREPVAECRNKG